MDSEDDLATAETNRRFFESLARSNNGEEQDPEVLEAATILCMLATAKTDEGDVALTMDMLRPTSTFETEDEEYGSSYHGYLDEDDLYEEPLPALPPPRASSNLHHPDRLAIKSDVDEVNRLHQYVRSDLLEIFVVPQVEEEDDDSSEDETYTPKRTKTESFVVFSVS